MELKLIDEAELKPGDILLCYSAGSEGKSDHIQNGYSHAVIVINNGEIAESSSSGVGLTGVSNLLDEYGHLAVLRSLESWSPQRLEKLGGFISSKLGSSFNSSGMYKLPKRKEKQQIEVMDRIHGYFEGTYKPKTHDRSTYFCSELVTSAFIAVGIIEESATIHFSPETFSPEDIGRDKAFGFFTGYIKSYEEYQIPEHDSFRTSI